MVGCPDIRASFLRLPRPTDRNKDVGEPYEIEAWVGFDFPGRGDQYSKMKWHWYVKLENTNKC